METSESVHPVAGGSISDIAALKTIRQCPKNFKIESPFDPESSLWVHLLEHGKQNLKGIM